MKKPGINIRIIGTIFACCLFLFILLSDFSSANPAANRMAAIAILMVILWITEAIPLAATSLFPLILFPLLGVMSIGKVSSEYFNSTIFLFMGGFMIALGMERWDLHRRISLRIIRSLSSSPSVIIFGIMLATAFLSMFISNTATAIMMMPIGLAIVLKLEENYPTEKTRKFSVSMMLGIAYAASIGGIATLIGTVPNLVFQRIFSISFPGAPPVSFGTWLVFGLPLCLAMLIFTWILNTRLINKPDPGLKIDRAIVRKEYEALGKIKFEESILLIDLFIAAFLWIFRQKINLGGFIIPGWSDLLPFPDMIDDGFVAVFMASILFFIPTKNKSLGYDRILDNDVFRKIPWDIIILFGGGFALAKGFQDSGLSALLGTYFGSFAGVHPIIMIALVCFVLTFLTEVTSNTATTQAVLPILVSLSVALRINPLLLMIPATISASFAFMLPVGTPPNAIVFGTGKIRIIDMVKTGFILNFIGIFVVTIGFYFLGILAFGIDPLEFPVWAVLKK